MEEVSKKMRESLMQANYMEALGVIESYGSRKKLDLRYFMNCCKICMAASELGIRDVALDFGTFVKEHYCRHTFWDEAKFRKCESAYADMCRECLDICARLGDFDSFCLAMEFYRKPSLAFYYPRRDVLRKLHIIQDLQDLADGKLDILAISMPQRTGKSRIGLFFITFYMMLHIDRERQIFGVGHDTGLIKTFYDEILDYLSDSATYRVLEIFPNHKVAHSDSEYYTISLDKKKGMPNLAFRSIDGSITGAVEGGLLMYSDDLIKDQSEIINAELADKVWSKFNTLVLGRMKNKVPLLYMGTMWGVNCPISRLRKEYSDKERLAELGLGEMRCRFNAISCYDENGESQFNYLFDVGFDTQYYKRIELTLAKADRPLWCAMYLAKPISRFGRPFEELCVYEKLPDRQPDYIACAIDVATQKGGDYWSCPLGLFYEKEREVYIDEVVYTNQGLDVSIPKTVEMFKRRRPIRCEVEEKEGNQGSRNRIITGIGAKINEMLMKDGIRMNIHSHNACGLKSKMERISTYRTDILGIATDFGWTVHFNKARCDRDRQYRAFIEDIINYSEDEKAQNSQTDDSVDSLAQLLEFGTTRRGGVYDNGVTLKSLGL